MKIMIAVDADEQWKGAHTFVSQADTVDFGFLWRKRQLN